MLEFLLFLLLLLVLFNFTEYKALKWAWKKGGLPYFLKMMVAVIVRFFLGIFIN